MKTKLIAAILAGIAYGAAHAADNATTNYFAGYKYVAAAQDTNTVADIGLATNTAYCCIPLATLAELTAGQAATTGDVRAVVYAIAQAFYVSYTASTNKTPTTITRATTYDSTGTNIDERATHVIRSTRRVGSATF